jgi:hypothetical protein
VLKTRRNRPAEALRLCEEAIALAPEYPNPYLGLAQLALDQHQPLAALEVLDRLFRHTRSEDIRSAPVYVEARRLYHEVSARAAEAEHGALLGAVEARRAELALATGHPIEIREDASLPVRSTVRLAWVHGTAAHTTVHRPTPAAELPHALMFQLEQIARDHEARGAGKARAMVGDLRTRGWPRRRSRATPSSSPGPASPSRRSARSSISSLTACSSNSSASCWRCWWSTACTGPGPSCARASSCPCTRPRSGTWPR